MAMTNGGIMEEKFEDVSAATEATAEEVAAEVEAVVEDVADETQAAAEEVADEAAVADDDGPLDDVIEAAKETDHYVIGVDRDQSYLAPNQVLTSALKMVNVAIERVSESYLRGEDIGGKTYSLGMTEGAVGIPTQHDNYKDEIYDATLLIEDKIKSGLIIPPATEKEYELFIKGL